MASRRWIWESPDWPGFTWDLARLAPALAAARRSQGELAGAARLLDAPLQTRAGADLLLQDALGTSQIEGEHPNPDGVRSSIARRLGLPHAGLPAPERTTEGLVDMLFDATQRYREPLTLERLCAWQASLFPEDRPLLRRIRTGQLRGDEPMRVVSGPLEHEKVHYEAVPRPQLEAEMERFLAWFAQPPSDLDGLLRAGIAHVWFELIHPFEDGNGRVGRALMDMALAQDEQRSLRLFSLSAQFLRERGDYYALLERVGKSGLDVTDWLLWFLQQVQAASVAAQATSASVLAKARFWMHQATTSLNERQRKVLNRLLDAGPDGFEGGMTTRKYVGLAKVSRATAFRELAHMVEQGCLVPTASKGRSAAYEIDWSRWT
ncbi:Fic family protein [Xanthomonas hyacinthi]|uniref:DUF4172 domain-containing protein n=1 Tax=Xanthomonas hyacinthi TaxID=56455 RepID=A0A2S7F278_9XANT|nr:Fic family protein [Xanthomonas hyacinthi]KLD77571.1 hypothetical protein Y886_15075 [Xanthomonas hyacinthi DSM 19077]PPU99442.1 DUF4172 domain-containing protein [Xanthomonas hyacinthi]QGY78442.1 Fic family protein [Xanthomonas hyacinthi]